MGYSNKSYAQAKAILDARRDKAQEEAQKNKDLIYAAVPEIKEIDGLLSSTAADLAIEIAKGPQNIEERINSIKEKNLALQARKKELLKANGYPEDHLKIKYHCEKCQDSGYVLTHICDCFKKELARCTLENSGIGKLAQTQSFESFDLKYYAQNTQELAIMRENFNNLKQYAEEFKLTSSSLMLMGKTGLGKTHLTTSVAKRIIEKGYDVVYDTAQNIMEDFQYERFSRGYGYSDDEKKTDKYFECDLLIIDDLGTEMVNNFTLSVIYNLINTRINKSKPMIISTNLSNKELMERYEERVTSRFMGEFSFVRFYGSDVRLQKLMK